MTVVQTNNKRTTNETNQQTNKQPTNECETTINNKSTKSNNPIKQQIKPNNQPKQPTTNSRSIISMGERLPDVWVPHLIPVQWIFLPFNRHLFFCCCGSRWYRDFGEVKWEWGERNLCVGRKERRSDGWSPVVVVVRWGPKNQKSRTCRHRPWVCLLDILITRTLVLVVDCYMSDNSGGRGSRDGNIEVGIEVDWLIDDWLIDWLIDWLMNIFLSQRQESLA